MTDDSKKCNITNLKHNYFVALGPMWPRFDSGCVTLFDQTPDKIN